MQQLNTLHALASEMLQLLEKEADCLKNADALPALDHISQSKAALASEIEQIAHANDTHILQLLKQVPDSSTHPDYEQASKVKALLQACKQKNNLNGERLAALKSRTERSIHILFGTSHSAVYAQSGSLQHTERQGTIARA